MKKTWFVILLVFLPLLLGSMVYLLGPSSRHLCENGVFPLWIRNHLPDGLWMFAFANAMFLIWHNKNTGKIWWLMPLPIAFILEFLQLNPAFGTFDVIDLACYVIGYFAALFCRRFIL